MPGMRAIGGGRCVAALNPAPTAGNGGNRASSGRWRTPSASFSIRPIPRCIGRPGSASRPSSAPTPCCRPSACWPSATRKGGAATMFDKTCWDDDRNRYACRSGRTTSIPRATSFAPACKAWMDAQTVDCHWLTAPRGKAGGRGKAVTLPCDTPVQLELPYPGGAWIKVEIGGQQVAEVAAEVQRPLHRRHGRQFRLGRRQSGRAGAVLVRSHCRVRRGRQQRAAGRLSRARRRLEDHRREGLHQENARWLDQACHRSLYSHQLRAALQLAVEEPHRAVTFVGVACSGAETVFGLFLRYKGHEWVPNPPELSQISAVAQAQCGGRERARLRSARGLPHEREAARAEGRPRAQEVRSRTARARSTCCSCRSAATTSALRVSSPMRCCRTSPCCAAGRLVRPGARVCRGRRLQMDALDDRLKAVNRAAHYILHVPWSESDRVVLTGYPPMALHGGWKLGVSGRSRRHERAARLLPERGQGARGQHGGRAAERYHGGQRAPAQLDASSMLTAAAFRGRGLCVGTCRWAPGPWPTSCGFRAR